MTELTKDRLDACETKARDRIDAAYEGVDCPAEQHESCHGMCDLIDDALDDLRDFYLARGAWEQAEKLVVKVKPDTIARYIAMLFERQAYNDLEAICVKIEG